MANTPYFGDAGTFTPDKLIGGIDFPIVTGSVTIKSGASLVRGTVLEESATAGKYQKVTDAADAVYILLEDVDATAADKIAAVAKTGSFNGAALTLGVGVTVAAITPVLEAKNIYITTAIAG